MLVAESGLRREPQMEGESFEAKHNEWVQVKDKLHTNIIRLDATWRWTQRQRPREERRFTTATPGARVDRSQLDNEDEQWAKSWQTRQRGEVPRLALQRAQQGLLSRSLSRFGKPTEGSGMPKEACRVCRTFTLHCSPCSSSTEKVFGACAFAL